MIGILGLIIPATLVFRQIFLPGSLAFGDAPYFYPEALKTFLSLPDAWTVINNGLGGVNLLVWITPLMAIYSYMGSRITFYFPAIIFSFLTPIFFTKHFKFSKTVQFFASLIYGLNTYFILLIDGGQVGVALAYSIFPFVLLSLYKDKFIKSLLFTFVLFLIDPRIAIVCLVTYFLWQPKKIIKLIKISVLLIPLNAFWVLPLLKNGGGGLITSVSSLGLTRFVHTITLYQPHWPGNIYGQVSLPPFYFIFLPILIFLPLFFKNNKNHKLFKKFAFLFLIFAFLAKGESLPFGIFYKFLVEKVPFGSVFRDSTKFFTPLMLFGSVLIGNSIDRFKNKFVNLTSYILILVLIAPALLGKMNFVLSNREVSGDYQKIYQHLKNDLGEYKTLWFPERPTLGFQSEKNPAVDAKGLINIKPIASLNTGSSDVFNFMSKEESSKWLQILGIKYMFFPGDTRKFDLSDEEKKEWDNLLSNVSSNPDFEKLDWGTDIEAYRVKNFKELSFEKDSLKASLGGDKENADIYLEDGVVNMEVLRNLPTGSFTFDIGNKKQEDLQFVFLQDYFLGRDDIKNLGWAKYVTDEYLLWKYQLLIRGIETYERDFQKGILLSTIKDESVVYQINTEKEGEYVVAVRGMGYGDNEIEITTEGESFKTQQKEGGFEWRFFKTDLNKGKNKISVTNKNGTQIVNTLAVVPVSKWQESKLLADEFIEKYGKEKSNESWLIYSQNYHPSFRLDCGNRQIESIPVYSSLNAFPLSDCLQQGEVYFEGQKWVDLGLKISVASFAIISLWAIFSRKQNR